MRQVKKFFFFLIPDATSRGQNMAKERAVRDYIEKIDRNAISCDWSEDSPFLLNKIWGFLKA
jgi:hypothetical protein